MTKNNKNRLVKTQHKGLRNIIRGDTPNNCFLKPLNNSKILIWKRFFHLIFTYDLSDFYLQIQKMSRRICIGLNIQLIIQIKIS